MAIYPIGDHRFCYRPGLVWVCGRLRNKDVGVNPPKPRIPGRKQSGLDSIEQMPPPLDGRRRVSFDPDVDDTGAIGRELSLRIRELASEELSFLPFSLLRKAPATHYRNLPYRRGECRAFRRRGPVCRYTVIGSVMIFTA